MSILNETEADILIQLIEMKEDLSAELTDLTRKQLYQSSWNLAGTLKHKVKVEFSSLEHYYLVF